MIPYQVPGVALAQGNLLGQGETIVQMHDIQRVRRIGSHDRFRVILQFQNGQLSCTAAATQTASKSTNR